MKKAIFLGVALSGLMGLGALEGRCTPGTGAVQSLGLVTVADSIRAITNEDEREFAKIVGEGFYKGNCWITYAPKVRTIPLLSVTGPHLALVPDAPMVRVNQQLDALKANMGEHSARAALVGFKAGYDDLAVAQPGGDMALEQEIEALTAAEVVKLNTQFITGDPSSDPANFAGLDFRHSHFAEFKQKAANTGRVINLSSDGTSAGTPLALHGASISQANAERFCRAIEQGFAYLRCLGGAGTTTFGNQDLGGSITSIMAKAGRTLTSKQTDFGRQELMYGQSSIVDLGDNYLGTPIISTNSTTGYTKLHIVGWKNVNTWQVGTPGMKKGVRDGSFQNLEFRYGAGMREVHGFCYMTIEGFRVASL